MLAQTFAFPDCDNDRVNYQKFGKTANNSYKDKFAHVNTLQGQIKTRQT